MLKRDHTANDTFTAAAGHQRHQRPRRAGEYAAASSRAIPNLHSPVLAFEGVCIGKKCFNPPAGAACTTERTDASSTFQQMLNDVNESPPDVAQSATWSQANRKLCPGSAITGGQKSVNSQETAVARWRRCGRSVRSPARSSSTAAGSSSRPIDAAPRMEKATSTAAARRRRVRTARRPGHAPLAETSTGRRSTTSAITPSCCTIVEEVVVAIPEASVLVVVENGTTSNAVATSTVQPAASHANTLMPDVDAARWLLTVGSGTTCSDCRAGEGGPAGSSNRMHGAGRPATL